MTSPRFHQSSSGRFDPDELVRWAELYGHPEEWAKKAQATHSRAEIAEERLAALQDWLLGTVGTASSVRSAQKAVEKLVARALGDQREAPEGGQR